MTWIAHWSVADLTEVMLPTGASVRGHLPTLGTLLRRDLLPRDLLDVALRAADPAWLTIARAIDPDEGKKARAYLGVLVAAFPRQRCEPGGEWQPWRLTAENTTDDSVDELELDALENLVLRLVSPEELTAASRTLLGLDADEPEVTGIAELAGFRGDDGSGPAGGDGEALGDPPLAAAAAGG